MTADKKSIFPDKYPKRYKLLKDLPTLKAGAIFVESLDFDGIWKCANSDYQFSEKDLHHNSDWFKKIWKWIPLVGEKYWYIPREGNIGSAIRPDTEAGNGFDSAWFAIQCDYGNIFETRADAEFCRDEYIKKAFKKYHEASPDGGAEG